MRDVAAEDSSATVLRKHLFAELLVASERLVVLPRSISSSMAVSVTARSSLIPGKSVVVAAAAGAVAESLFPRSKVVYKTPRYSAD